MQTIIQKKDVDESFLCKSVLKEFWSEFLILFILQVVQVVNHYYVISLHKAFGGIPTSSRDLPQFFLVFHNRNNEMLEDMVLYLHLHSIVQLSIDFHLGESPETMRKLCLSAKFPHQEIRWNYGILHSDSIKAEFSFPIKIQISVLTLINRVLIGLFWSIFFLAQC